VSVSYTRKTQAEANKTAAKLREQYSQVKITKANGRFVVSGEGRRKLQDKNVHRWYR